MQYTSRYKDRINTQLGADPYFNPLCLLQFQNRAFGSTETDGEAAGCGGSGTSPEIRDSVRRGTVQTGTPQIDCSAERLRNVIVEDGDVVDRSLLCNENVHRCGSGVVL